MKKFSELIKLRKRINFKIKKSIQNDGTIFFYFLHELRHTSITLFYEIISIILNTSNREANFTISQLRDLNQFLI